MARIRSDVLLGGRYRLIRRIATGGMGVVWEAEDAVLHRPVAVKILSDSLSSDDRFVERFRREATAAARLSHPSVAGVFDYGVDDGSHFIVMELIRGETLAARLARGPLPWQEAVRITELAADALQHAHTEGVVHRDVKPGNIMLSHGGGVKVMDFGIAAAAGAAPITVSGTTMGTATYISPEQAGGQRATSASDVYSLGVVLYEMLTGRPPFSGNTPVAVASAHVHEAVAPVRSLAPEVPAHVAAACERALAKDPAHRPATASALAAMLRSPSASPSVTPPPAGVEDPGEPTRTIAPPAGTAVLPQVPRFSTTDPEIAEAPVRGRREAGPRRPRRTWPGVVLGLLTAAAILLVALALLLRGNVPSTVVPGASRSPSVGTVTVPDVTGKTETEAMKILEDEGLTVAGTQNVEGPDGKVVATSPPSGEVVAPGTPVTLLVGTGPTPTPTKDHGKGNGKGKGGGD
jgi:hypothetical protein